jgi:ElaB/YqjD/DUF883 family membrane-anchored ribosome-binding protein
MATTAETFSNMSDQVDDVVAKKSSQMGKFLDDVEDLLRHVTPIEDSTISRARERVESSIHSVRNAAGRSVHQAMESTKAAARKTDSFVHESPWTAIGIAAVAGLVIASVVRNK